jgi:coproporphyrinogen III oxidase
MTGRIPGEIEMTMRHSWGTCRRGLALGAVTLGLLATRAAAENAVPAALTMEQQALADRMQAFQDKTETVFFQRVKQLNGGLALEEKVFDYDAATHTVKVSRGKVVEKAGWYANVQKKGMPPLVPDPLFSRYMEIDVHPATPHVGMLHATLYFTYLRNGTGMLGGYMDYVPGVVHAEDNQRLKQAVERVFAKHNEDIGRFRTELCESEFGAKHHRDALQAACVGVSLYARPMMKIDDRNLNLATEAFQAITDTYFEILSERKRQGVTAADRLAQDGMRKRWLEDQLFADTFSRKVVPYEVWSLANLPPTVRF